MILQSSGQVVCAQGACKESTHRRKTPRAGALVVTLCSVCIVLTLAVAAQGKPTPPPAPQVAPVISTEYPNDLNGNGIDDVFEQMLADSGKGATSGTKSRDQIASSSDETVSVELIFMEPVTQGQIDTFVSLGGEIAYMYQTISYGWIGRIALKNLEALRVAMGPSLAIVESTSSVSPYTEQATQSGRVRAVWQPGFAGNVSGFSGDPNTTIGFVDTGVDPTHSDLAGRLAYWNDLSFSLDPNPSDDNGHGTATVGVAVGSGKAAGASAGPFTFTYSYPWAYYSAHATDPITLPAGSVTMTSRLYWSGSVASFAHIRWGLGTSPDTVWAIGSVRSGMSGMTVTNSFTASGVDVYSAYLFSPTYQNLGDVVMVNTISRYPDVGDGFNKFRGVAPDCNYAMVRIPYDVMPQSFENALGAGIDVLVTHRVEKNIKIVSISSGLLDFAGLPVQSASMRNKIASAVNNGVVVVCAVGNSAADRYAEERVMADPARAAMAITVGASNDKNALTEYSTYGFANPDTQDSEDFKPDLIAPGGSWYYTSIVAPDSGTSDALGADKEPNDYTTGTGTSFSSPFVAGCAALVIQAMERQGTRWDFASNEQPRYVKTVLCATASETNANRESNLYNPTLQRAGGGPAGFPAGKDPYEGYGLVNPDAAAEAVSLAYVPMSSASDTFGAGPGDRRVWARNLDLTLGCDIDVTLDNPSTGDFDLYLYSAVPGDTGTPVILASSTNAGAGVDEALHYSPTEDVKTFLVVKRVSGAGTFTVNSSQSGPPVARDVSKSVALGSSTVITLDGMDDGSPNPPGKLVYAIASLPQHGRLAHVGGGAVIDSVPTVLGDGVKEVMYRSDPNWVGDDSFTYYADDGGVAPFGGQSNIATVSISVVREITVTYQVTAANDDGYMLWGSSYLKLDDPSLSVGMYGAGMRFTRVAISQGAHILRAVLKVCSYTSGLTPQVNPKIYAEATDDAASLTGRRLNALPLTTAYQTWSLTTMWQPNTWYESVDIASVIQEIVNRPGWAADGSMLIICTNSAGASFDRQFWSYDGDPSKAAQLEVTYQP
jgi:subtilisin family serine protease